jgi:hypothetical protein
VTGEGSPKKRRKKNITQRRPDPAGVNAERRGHAENQIQERNRENAGRHEGDSGGNSADEAALAEVESSMHDSRYHRLSYLSSTNNVFKLSKLASLSNGRISERKQRGRAHWGRCKYLRDGECGGRATIRPVLRHLLPQPCVSYRHKHELSFRSLVGGVCRCDGVLPSLSAAPLGAMGGLRHGLGYQLFQGHESIALPIGCVFGGSAGLYHDKVRRTETAIDQRN